MRKIEFSATIKKSGINPYASAPPGMAEGRAEAESAYSGLKPQPACESGLL
jgi:hypothetical protein